MGSCSQFGVILHPHRVAGPFAPTLASPWRNSFVQIRRKQVYSRQNLDHLGKTSQKPSKFRGGVIWARGKRRGCSPGATARHSQHARVSTDFFSQEIFFFRQNRHRQSDRVSGFFVPEFFCACAPCTINDPSGRHLFKFNLIYF